MPQLLRGEDVGKALLTIFGIEDFKCVRAIHVHCQAGEPAYVEIDRLVYVDDAEIANTTRYRLIEVEG